MFAYRFVHGIIGGLAGIVLRTVGQQGTLLRGLAVIVSVCLLALMYSPLLGIGPDYNAAFGSLLLAVSLLGAVKLLATDQPLRLHLSVLMP
jgi:hypothetical protein